MPAKSPRLQPGESVLLLVDPQAELAFGVSSEDRQTLVNNVVALARTAVVFGLPVVVWTSASKVYRGPFMPGIAPDPVIDLSVFKSRNWLLSTLTLSPQ